MRIKVLGPLEVADDGDLLALGGPQQRLVLAMLVARADATVPTDSLIDALWNDEEPPKRARKTVQVYVANLRKVLGGDDAPIESASGGYVLRTGIASVDAVDFESAVNAVAEEHDPDPRRAVEQLSAALALWNGPPYADLGDAAALTPEITRLNELRLAALERRLEESLTLGQHREVLGELDTLTTDHPYREGFTALQMLALYRSGRQAEALRSYQRTRLVLGEELGIEPSPQVRALEQAILSQDQSLDLAAAPVAAPAAEAVSARPDTRSIRGYELREQLDETGEASLWRAYQPATGREVALRIFDQNVANEPAFVKHFEPETQRIAQLEHPHLVSIYDFWRDPDGAYVVMPLLRGGTLADSLGRGRWKMSAALRMLDQVGSALVALHRHGLHHGSVGADCVLLDTDSNAYLADVGRTVRTGGDAAPASDVADLAVLFSLTAVVDDVSADLAAVLDRADEHDRVEDLLRAVRQSTGSDAVGVASDLAADRPAAANPYKGLRAFQETDATDFFGREVLVSRLVDSVTERPLTTVVGSSGSGKSSVVKAGLIPAVRGGALGGDWLVAEMFPGTFPFEELEAALTKVAVDRPDGLMADLTADDRGMLRVIKRVLPDDGTGLLLVIDQFEELFSLTPDEDTRRLFLDNLVTLGSDARSRVRTVLTLRADFFDRPLDHPEFAELVQRGLVTVAMPDQDNLALMVSQPARQAGLDLEPGLVTEVVRDVMEQPGGLPLMQYALTELAERSDGRTLTSAGYRESGGVLGALGQRAEEIFQGLQPSAREVAERIFLRLVTVDENADDTRRRIRRTELTALGLDRAAVDAVLQEFGSFRLLSFDHDPTTRGPTVEVAHEALIREWPRLRSWVDDRRDDLLLERRLREAVVEWEAADRDPGYLLRGGRLEQFEDWADAAPGQVTDGERRLIDESRAGADAEHDVERRRLRRLRRLVAAVGVALVAALVAGAVALREQDQAELATDQAESAAGEAELATLISQSAAQSREDPELSLLLALEAHQRAPGAETEQAVLNALGSSTNANRVASLEPLVDRSSSCAISIISSDGTAETAIIDGRLVRRDLISGTVTDLGESPTSCGWWIGDPDADRIAVESPGGLRHWYGPFDGPPVEADIDEPMESLLSSFRPNNRSLYVLPESGFLVRLRDDRTGELIGPPVGATSGGEFVGAGDVTADGSLVAVGYAVDGDPRGDGRTFLVDGETGEEIFHVNSPVPAEQVIFDVANGHLIAAMFDGTIMTIDLETGAVVSQVVTTTTSRLLDLGVRRDGILIAVSQGQVEFVDRWSGPTGAEVELRNAVSARIRPDGTLLILTSGDRIETFDLDSNSLVEHAWEFDPSGHTAFNAGMAGVLDGPTGVAEVVDLETGERTTYGLLTPTGEQFPAVKIYAEVDGVWAFSQGNVMARWEGEEMVERVELGGFHFNRTRHEDLIGVISELPDESRVADLVSVERGATRVVFSVPAPDVIEVHPSLDGGLHLIDTAGMLTTYDASGVLTSEIDTGVEELSAVTMDPATGKVALVAFARELAIIDTDTATVDRLDDVGTVNNLGFGRDGELLALTNRDGTVRLWDVEREEYAGLVWNGSGAGRGSPSWYDDATGTMWVASSGRYLGIPLDPDRWVEKACETVSRDLTQDEWDRFVPGDEPLRSACV